MKGAGAALSAKLLTGINKRKLLVEEIQLLGRVKRKDVEAARQ